MKIKDIARHDRAAVLKFVRSEVEDARQAYADHAEYVASFAGTGYRPHYCIHGANLWVDHDIACGQCEEQGYGVEFHYPDHALLALGVAKSKLTEVYKRRAMVMDLLGAGAPISSDLYTWTAEPLGECWA